MFYFDICLQQKSIIMIICSMIDISMLLLTRKCTDQIEM